jgi:hypothetical protein
MFEQSGTFKNEFKKLGYVAVDYDILNDFNETDYIMDLFNEINLAYDGNPSLFDSIQKDDLIMAFFPCIRFEDQILLCFRGENSAYKNWSIEKKLENDIKLHQELNELYTIITKFVLVCLKRNLRLIIENPYTTQHYLHRYWAIKPAIIDNDRRDMGDYFKKPTQYFFINCSPSNNFIFEGVDRKITKKIKSVGTVERSMISKDYANRFIREFILDED